VKKKKSQRSFPPIFPLFSPKPEFLMPRKLTWFFISLGLLLVYWKSVGDDLYRIHTRRLEEENERLQKVLAVANETAKQQDHQLERMKKELQAKNREISMMIQRGEELASQIQSLGMEKKDLMNQLVQGNRLEKKDSNSSGNQSPPPPAGAAGATTDVVSLEKYEQTKFALKWLNIFKGETYDPLIARFLRNAEKIPRVFKSRKGSKMASSWKCYEMQGTDFVRVFDGISAGSVCVFENLCAARDQFMLYGDLQTEFPYSNGELIDWPQTMNGAGPKIHYYRQDDLESFLNYSEIQWVEEPAYIIGLSNEAHITHWLETLGTLFMGREYLSEEAMPNAEVVYLANHPRELFDWQLHVLAIAMKRKIPPKIKFPREFMMGDIKKPICFKKSVLPGYQFYLFTTAEAGISFKHQAYEYLGLPLPIQIRQVVTISKRGGRRSISNIPEIEQHIRTNYPHVEVQTVEFGKLSFAEQVKLMHSSGILISIHGADCTNLMFLPDKAVFIEVNPYRWYENRFFGFSFTVGVEYFSYNCGKRECSSAGASPDEIVKNWPISYYPPATENKCREELSINGRRDTNVNAVIEDFDVVLREAFGYLGWGPKVRDSPWN